MSAQPLEVVGQMLPVDMQKSNEYQFSKRHIDSLIRMELADSLQAQAKITEGTKLVHEWLSKSYYESKDVRLAQVRSLDIRELVTSIFVGITYFTEPVLFVRASAQLANRLQFNSKLSSIQTVGELLAVLCHTDVFDIYKPNLYGSLHLSSRIRLSDRCMRYIENSIVLPPMVCQPKEIKHNHQSGHLTYNDSVILKNYNHHDEDVCLDVVNLQNSIPLSLSVSFIRKVEELPSKDLDVIDDPGLSEFQKAEIIRDRKRQWAKFKEQSQKLYAMMVRQGNEFYLTHKVDKRGRLYSQGYHITTQGSKYKRAMIELAEKEVVSGVST